MLGPMVEQRIFVCSTQLSILDGGHIHIGYVFLPPVCPELGIGETGTIAAIHTING